MHSEDAGLLQRNLSTLSRINPGLAALIAQEAPSPLLSFRRSRRGSLVPVLRAGGGEQPLHSLVDPDREAERMVQSLGDVGYLVCFGLGGGSVAAAFLRQPGASGLLVIEKDSSTLRSLLENVDLASVLSDGRVSITIGLTGIRSIVRSSYIPTVSGNLASLAVRPWCAFQSAFFDAAAAEVRDAVEEAQADYGVQAAFGKRWFANIVANLPAAEMVPTRQVPAGLLQGGLAHVTAAGPSLDESLPSLSTLRDGGIVIAADTSLPALLRAGVQPDIVMSLDCQPYSYHHFLAGVPRAAALFFDLASPPFLVRRGGAQSRFFASAHPLARFISAAWRGFPVLDTTGGNVTHAAVSLAGALGISTVRLHGADFSYPRAKPYARGTYLYDYFLSREGRYVPLESSLASFVLRSPGLTVLRGGPGVVYTTPTLRDYKARLETLMAKTSSTVRLHSLDVSPARCSWRDFLGGYAEAVGALPGPSEPLGRRLASLSPAQRELWATLLPVSARFLRETSGSQSRAACLEMSRCWALERVARMLDPRVQRL